MPNFFWRGVNLQGEFCNGFDSSVSISSLEEELLKNDIAVTSWSVQLPFSVRFVRQVEITDFFGNLAVLLESGMNVPQALDVLIQQVKNRGLAVVIKNISDDVKSGTRFYKALSVYPNIFNSFVIHIVRLGEESGSLYSALFELSKYRRMFEEFYKNMRAVAMLPAIGFIVFLFVVTLIFTVVVPMFASVLESSGAEIPNSTRMIISASGFIRSPSALRLLIFIGFFSAGLWFLFKFKSVCRAMDKVVLFIPVVRTLVKNHACILILKGLYLLVKNGVHPVTALRVVKKGLRNYFLRKQIERIIDSVSAGCSLHDEFAKADYGLFTKDVVALIAVGQESGKLESLLEQACLVTKNNIKKYLNLITSLLQPTFIFMLGILVVLLICLVYIPIFNMSKIVV